MANELLNNLERLHTTELGMNRIAKNMGIEPGEAMAWCKAQIGNPESITRTGKNWYVRGKGFAITVNAGSYTIITAHREKPKKGSDMRDVAIIKKLDDIPELKEKLVQAFDTKTHRNVSKYGLLLADHVLQTTKMPMNEAIEACYSVNRRWQEGGATFQAARDAAGVVLDLARAEKDVINEKALRALAQVAATPHVKRHALIASDYAVKVINLMHPGNIEEVRKERELQIRLMESV